jgi:hypothetical protein
MERISDKREYHLQSNDPQHFNRINCPKIPLLEGYTGGEISVINVNFRNAIRILKETDYIAINGTAYFMNTSRTAISAEAWISILERAIRSSGVAPHLDECKIIYFVSASNFTIDDMSYNVSLLCGITRSHLPKISEIGTSRFIYMDQYGDYNSTPVLYLTSNIGQSGYVQEFELTELDRKTALSSISDYSLFMKINNSISPHFPVSFYGGDYRRSVDVMNIHNISFTLYDANMVELDLLYPMRLSFLIIFYRFERLPDNIGISDDGNV